MGLLYQQNFEHGHIFAPSGGRDCLYNLKAKFAHRTQIIVHVE